MSDLLGAVDDYRDGIEKGNLLEETDQNVVGCSVMISYCRTDKAFVKLLHDALAVDERQIWIDWEDIPPTADWLDEIHKGIERSDCFICVLSPDSIKNEICSWELDYALNNGKRIIPVVCKDVSFKEVDKRLSSLNWIFFRPTNDEFKAAMKLLQHTLDDNIRHAKYHTKLLCTALEWQKTNYEKSLLLRGNDLVRARHWLSASALGKEPKPTTLHLSYITASEKQQTSLMRRRLVALFFAFIVAIGIIWPSWGVFFFSLVFSHLFVYFAASAN